MNHENYPDTDAINGIIEQRKNTANGNDSSEEFCIRRLCDCKVNDKSTICLFWFLFIF